MAKLQDAGRVVRSVAWLEHVHVGESLAVRPSMVVGGLAGEVHLEGLIMTEESAWLDTTD